MEKQLCAYALRKILEEFTDETKTIRISWIIELLETRYDMKVKRWKIYATIKQLESLGEKIEYDSSQKGYRLKSRLFTKGEILMLCNAIHASNFIPHEESSYLISKLISTLSRNDQKEFNDAVFLPNNKKTDNDELMANIAAASTAITRGKKLSFYYMHYIIKNGKADLDIRRNEQITIEPRYICYVDGRPYLIVQGGREPGYMHYRLDRMSFAEVTDEDCIIPFDRVDAYQYANNKLFMFTGRDVHVTIKCNKRVIDAMVDLFGKDIFFVKTDENHYTFSVVSTDTGIIFLAQQYLDAIEVIAPEEIRIKTGKAISQAANMYSRR